MNKQKALLKKMINEIRDQRKHTIHSDELNEEELYYLTEGYREGLCCAAMILADELDTFGEFDGEEGFLGYLEQEEWWWHTHNDDEGDIGSPDRLK